MGILSPPAASVNDIVVSRANTWVAISQQRSPSLTSCAKRGRLGLRSMVVLILLAEVWLA